MRRLHSLLFVLVVMMFGHVVEAQCLKCVPVTFSYGTCDDAWPDNYCDRGCCGEYIGKLCTFPDFSDPCFPWSPQDASLVRLPAKADLKAAYFVTHKPIEKQQERLHRRLQTLDPAAPRCGRSAART